MLMPTVIMIKRIMRSLEQRFCRHDFKLMDTEYNKISMKIGCGNALSYRCTKCGKIVWMKY